MASPGETTEETGTSDALYNLVSVLYHALQGAETCGQYIADAERSGDTALSDFFTRVQAAQQRLADDAKQILRERIEAMGTGASEAEEAVPGPGVRRRRGGGLRVRAEPEDTVEEASQESFPASDPPAY